MALQLTKDSIDLGIVVKDPQASLAFYRDTVGMTDAGDGPMGGGSHMYRLMCGTSMVKLLTFAKPPKGEAPPGGINGGTGYRYFTITVANIEEVTKACGDAGYTVAMGVTNLRPGITISMVLDPDGNTVEFLQAG